ncbi:MAG: FAD:protein FMN transferase, partial [Planctomycetota bacterium]|nr:FAD:protein FMN transferase [Planctomycetota bacterium]
GRLNRQAAGAWLEVNPLTWEVIMQALRLHRLTEGAFDITVEPLLRLYHYCQGEIAALPPAEEIAAARQRVGSDKILYEREGMRLGFKVDGMAIDLGGLAPGFAVDRAAAALTAVGIRQALVELGGEVRLLGNSPAALAASAILSAQPANGSGWRVAIRHPRQAAEKIAVLTLSDCAVATSGDYEKYFVCQGKRYSHIVDPRTGYPVCDGVVSATVIHPSSCLVADALATAFCVLGAEGTARWLKEFGEDMPDLAGIKAILFVLQPDGTLQRIDLSAPAVGS